MIAKHHTSVWQITSSLKTFPIFLPFFQGRNLRTELPQFRYILFHGKILVVSHILLFHLCFWKAKKKHSLFWETQFKETHRFLLPKKNTQQRLSWPYVIHRVHTEWQLPISGLHPIMTEKTGLACEGGGGCMLTTLHSSYHHVQSCSVRSSWEGRYTPCIWSLPIFLVL